MNIAIGSDCVGLVMKNELAVYLNNKGHNVLDIGVKEKDEAVYYADVAETLALMVREQRCERGILVCGTGIGMAICANKVPGAYAALCHDVYSAKRAQLSNNAKIITLGSRVIGVEAAKVIVDAFLACAFEAGCRSQKNVDRVQALDLKYKR